MLHETTALSIPRNRAARGGGTRRSSGKWSIREVIQHLADSIWLAASGCAGAAHDRPAIAGLIGSVGGPARLLRRGRDALRAVRSAPRRKRASLGGPDGCLPESGARPAPRRASAYGGCSRPTCCTCVSWADSAALI